MIEDGERRSCECNGERKERKMAESEPCRGVGWMVWSRRTLGIVLPCINKEAVEAAKRGQKKRRRQQREAQLGPARDRGNEGSGGKEDADGDLLGKAMGAAGGVDEDEVSEEQAAEDEVEVDRLGGETEQQRRECCRSQQYPGKEEAAMTVVKVVAGFEVLLLPRLAVEQPRVEKAVGGVEHPHGDKHRGDRRGGKADVVGGGDEPHPESGDGGSIEREQMPEH